MKLRVLVRAAAAVTIAAGSLAPRVAWSGQERVVEERADEDDPIVLDEDDEPAAPEDVEIGEVRMAQQGLREAEAAARERERRERDEERAERDKQRALEEAGRADERYERGTEALDEGRWDRAVRAFEEVCRSKGPRCDGALYWKAYALNRLGRRNEARDILAELRKAYPQSRWLTEAKALELETQQVSGTPMDPDQSDEELKLLALNSLMNSNSERALPLLEDFLKANRSPRLQDRALFVLSQSDAPRAREVLLAIARGAQNPDLQTRAVKYLGMSGDEASLRALSEVYTTADSSVRRRILEAFMVGDDKKRVFAAAQNEKDPDLRRQAINLLGAMSAVPELVQLYKAETAAELRREILGAFVAADAASALIEVAKGEKDSRLRLTAVRNLGAVDSDKAGPFLVSLYATEVDLGVRTAILDAFVAQDNCAALVKLARTEKDAQLRKSLVERLGAMECTEATDFLLEILKK